LPDPKFNAYRKDLADAALADRVIASHYAEPAPRLVLLPATLRIGPSVDSESLLTLEAGDPFLLLDDSLGWAWGYAGKDRLVGYLPSETLAAQ
jgi:hypothetical protein